MPVIQKENIDKKGNRCERRSNGDSGIDNESQVTDCEVGGK